MVSDSYRLVMDFPFEMCAHCTKHMYMLFPCWIDNTMIGHISASELLNINPESFPSLPPVANHRPQTLLHWFQCAWPLMDWKLGLFLWRSCKGLLLLIIAASMIPGRLHGVSSQLLRWPVLFFTYAMITAELMVYIIVRLFIGLAESVFSSRKHGALRRQLEKAKSYEEWHGIARLLDKSQGRDKWQRTIDDDTSYQYNWAFIKELISDMKRARREGDVLLALAVLQQCTRKNVGGVMSADLFAWTYTGEPKLIVQEFFEEVVTTLRWLAERTKTHSLLRVDSEVQSSSSEEEDGKTLDSPQSKNYKMGLDDKVRFQI